MIIDATQSAIVRDGTWLKLMDIVVDNIFYMNLFVQRHVAAIVIWSVAFV